MTISIRGARVIDPASGLDQVGDLHIEAGKIVAIGAAPAGFSAQKTLDGAGLVAAPGLVDLSVALREPGYGRKGNVESETRAAAAGGTTSLCCPPYTRPVLDTPAVAELILDRAREAGNGLPGARAPSRISWRIARWIRACSGRAWSCGWRSRALTDSSSDCLNKWSALDHLIGGIWQAIRRL